MQKETPRDLLLRVIDGSYAALAAARVQALGAARELARTCTRATDDVSGFLTEAEAADNAVSDLMQTTVVTVALAKADDLMRGVPNLIEEMKAGRRRAEAAEARIAFATSVLQAMSEGIFIEYELHIGNFTGTPTEITGQAVAQAMAAQANLRMAIEREFPGADVRVLVGDHPAGDEGCCVEVGAQAGSQIDEVQARVRAIRARVVGALPDFGPSEVDS